MPYLKVKREGMPVKGEVREWLTPPRADENLLVHGKHGKHGKKTESSFDRIKADHCG